MHATAGKVGAPAVELVERSARCDFQLLGEHYLQCTSHLPGSEPYFTDKMPLNLPLLRSDRAQSARGTSHTHQASSNGRVSGDVQNKFKQGYPFSYDIGEIAQYYMAYRALMAHWERLFPGRIFDIQYEELVRSPREQSEAMLRFCGLEWENSCLQFHTSSYPSATASASQVRRPLYQSSLSSWRNYESEFSPLKNLLLQQGLDPSEVGD